MKQVFLDFEQPIAELMQKVEELHFVPCDESENADKKRK